MIARFISITLLFVMTSFVLVACDSPEEKTEAYLKRGDAFFEKKKYNKARVEYKNALKLQPTNAALHYQLALAYEALDDMPNAFGSFMTAELQDSTHQPTLLKLAQYYMASKNYEESEKRLDKLVELAPNDSEVHALRAMLFFYLDKPEDSEKEARLALEQDDSNVTASIARAYLYKKQGDASRALTTVNQALEKKPEEFSLLFLKAHLQKAGDDSDGTIQTYKQIFKLKPKEASFRIELALFLIQKERLDEAETVLREGAQALPNNLEIEKELVFFLSNQRGLIAAEKEMQKLTKEAPQEIAYPLWLAEIYSTHKKTDKAMALLKDLIDKKETDEDALEKEDFRAHTALAELYLLRNEAKQARRLVDLVLEKKPDNSEALFLRASLFFNERDYQKTVLALRLLIRDVPDDVKALNLLKETLLKQGKPNLALDAVNKIIALDPNNFRAKLQLANFWTRTNEPERALALLEDITKRAPQFAAGWENTAYAALGAKNWEKAQEAIAQLDTLAAEKPLPLILRGELLFAQDKKEAAVLQLQKARQTYPTNHRAGMIEADILISLNRSQEALDLYDSLLAANPKAQDTTNNMAQLIADTKADDPKYLEKAQKLAEPFQNSYDPFLLDTLAWVYFRQGKMQHAYDIMQKVLKDQDSLPQPFYYHYGLILAKMGKTEQAKEMLTLATDGNAYYLGREEALATLSKLRKTTKGGPLKR